MRTILLITYLSFCGYSFAESQPIPKEVPPITNKAERPDKPQNTPNSKQPVSNQPALTINQIVGGKLNVESKHNNSERNEEPIKGSEWLVAFFTGLLVVVTGYLVYYTKKLWGSTSTLVDDAKDTAKRQLRAYVVVDKCKIDRLDGIPNTLLVHIIMKNCGQTPAHDVTCDIDILMDEMDKIISYTSKGVPVEQRESIHIVGPQSTFEIKKRLTLTNEGEFAKFNEGGFKIQIITRIDYKDIFEDDQHFISTSISGDFFPSEGTGLLKSLGHWTLIPQQRGQNKAT